MSLRLRPAPKRAGRCPRDGGPLDVRGLHVTGWRSLLQGGCPKCGHAYVQDLPLGHGLVYPATLDLATGETLTDAGTSWFSDALQSLWQRPDEDPVEVTVTGAAAGSSVVLLNCLDKVYGHAVLKLLNAGRLLREGVPCVVLVPSALTFLVPEGVDEVWSVHAPVGRLGRRLLDLERQIDELTSRFDEVSLDPAYPHPHPSTFDVDAFTPAAAAHGSAAPQVVLSLRADRAWGLGGRDQQRRVGALMRRLRRSFPEMTVTAVGFPRGSAGLPEDVVDLRTDRSTPEDERRWLDAMAGADLAIGVHGSNLLLPSALARATIELLPRGRYGNLFQATIVRERDPLEALQNHRTLYGNHRMSDISGERVGELASVLLGERERFAALMLGPAAGLDGPGEEQLPSAAIDLEVGTGVLDRAAPRVRDLEARIRRAPATVRVIAAQRTAAVRARRVGLPAVLTDERGLRYEMQTRAEVASFLRHRGHFERGEITLLAGVLKPGEVALDVGANVGMFSVPLARAVAPGGTVHAFEPFPANVARLRRNLELNDARGVVVQQLAVGASSDPVDLVNYGEGRDSWASTVPRTIQDGNSVIAPEGRLSVASTSLDAYCAANGIDHIAVAKVDVEGGEPAVLAGAQGLLAAGAIDLLLMELSDDTLPADVSSHDLVDTLLDHGLDVRSFERGKLVPFRPVGHVYFANIVATRRPSRRSTRL